MSEVVATSTIHEPPSKSAARRDAILDAAKQTFTEKGFEVATIQDVATACGMSAGNIYRYFTSKAEIVYGLVERDRAQMAERFAELAAAPNQIESFEKLGRSHIKHECASHAKLTLEIWAAGTRRPELRQMCLSMEEAVIGDLRKFVNRLEAEHRLAPGVDPDIVCHLIMTLAQAMFRDSALNPSHDIDRDLDIMFAVIGAALAGHIQVQQQQTEMGKAAQ